jgi:hypothetical protein
MAARRGRASRRGSAPLEQAGRADRAATRPAAAGAAACMLRACITAVAAGQQRARRSARCVRFEAARAEDFAPCQNALVNATCLARAMAAPPRR